jgi:hypothetical protein
MIQGWFGDDDELVKGTSKKQIIQINEPQRHREHRGIRRREFLIWKSPKMIPNPKSKIQNPKLYKVYAWPKVTK